MYSTHDYSFEKLEVWKDSRKLVKLTYDLTNQFPKSEMYCLTNQMKRAAISICSNLSEGSGRYSSKDQAHFYQMSYSSLLELLNQFYIAFDLQYIEQNDLEIVKMSIYKISNKINSLRKQALKKHINSHLNNSTTQQLNL
jgi:four helix bundle protein